MFLPIRPIIFQRSGRSGRREETRALTFTMCKDNPHEMAAFANSRWAFDTALPVPGYR